jgi:PTS system arbutin-like IIC component
MSNFVIEVDNFGQIKTMKRSRIATARHVVGRANSYSRVRPVIKKKKATHPTSCYEDFQMLSQIQRFGGAMFTPVLLFPFAGIVVGIAIMLRNPMFVGEALTAPDSLFAQIVHIIEEGGWTVFRNMPLIFAVGLPIGLAKQAQGRACLAVLVSFLTWNYFINAMGMTWGHFFGVDFSVEPTAGSGLTMIAGIKTLDTSIIGAIVISGLVTALHNRYFDKPLPVFLGIFQGSSFVVIVAFLAMIPCAWLTLLGWPKVGH